MSALDLSTAEKLDYIKASTSRRKSNIPQRRSMAVKPSDLVIDTEGSVASEDSIEKSDHETNSNEVNNTEAEANTTPMTVSLLEQRDRMAELLSMTSRLPYPLGQPAPQSKMNPNDALAFLQAYGKMRSTSMFGAMQGSLLSPPRERSPVGPSDHHVRVSSHKMVELIKSDKTQFETNRNNNSSNGNSRSPSESSNGAIDDMGTPTHDMASIMHLNSTLAAGTLMQQRLRRYLDDVQPAEAPGIPERTKKQNRWAFNVWREWARKRNMLEDSFAGVFKGVPLDVGQATEAELDFWLSKFVVEIRRKDGNPYPPHTLMQIVMGIQRYLRQQAGKPSICILDRSNPTYTKFRTILDARIKELTNNGATAMQKSQSSILLPKETIDHKISALNLSGEMSKSASEEGMWQAGIIGTESAQALLNAVFFYNHQTFGIHYVDDHWNLRAENFTFGKNDDKSYIQYTPLTTSMMVATATAVGNSVAPKRIYKNNESPKCIVTLYMKYLSLVPTVGPFYRHPVEPTIVDRSVKFSEQWVGKNRLRAMLKHLIETYKHAAVAQKGYHVKKSTSSQGLQMLSMGLPQALIQLPSQSAEDLLPPAASEKLGIIRPMSVLRSPGEHNDEPPAKIHRSITPQSGVVSPKTEMIDRSSPKVSYSDVQTINNSTLELAVPDSIKSVTIQRGSRKITIQLD